jgi:hypothetical protein
MSASLSASSNDEYNSGLSVLSDDWSTYAFTNLLDGIELYSATTLAHQDSIAQPVDPSNNLALGLVIVPNAYVIVGGNRGTISIYNWGTGGLVARLHTSTSTGTPSYF